ncbi:hypothetical protein TTHERM_00858050 (macronuclear) [Tetrahymena thermophila SB210]|uniref:Uncharacterized protein n=1 Tax=Tetrahymena thermophila (strain SB210) TaxID=312017 RepID=Q23YV3_TETTS|nr:hypothetical protein TTHERM_00858050 [Tetrahymena thermophila SB210]EAS01702.2 hypothetical protein TTHERM_00858050 [Tetrahymena thermophila SB210]|eukprot:XP_001021947.2 hypothetical protein TTHERM_00858050 [Tetrahymena thermophila SB210]
MGGPIINYYFFQICKHQLANKKINKNLHQNILRLNCFYKLKNQASIQNKSILFFVYKQILRNLLNTQIYLKNLKSNIYKNIPTLNIVFFQIINILQKFQQNTCRLMKMYFRKRSNQLFYIKKNPLQYMNGNRFRRIHFLKQITGNQKLDLQLNQFKKQFLSKRMEIQFIYLDQKIQIQNTWIKNTNYLLLGLFQPQTSFKKICQQTEGHIQKRISSAKALVIVEYNHMQSYLINI